MNRAVLAIAALVLIPVVARAQSLPTFDSTAYCNQISDSSGGSYAIMEGCLLNEKNAVAMLEAKTIEPRIIRYCSDVARFGGGSYALMQGCVMNEENSKRNLGIQ